MNCAKPFFLTHFRYESGEQCTLYYKELMERLRSIPNRNVSLGRIHVWSLSDFGEKTHLKWFQRLIILCHAVPLAPILRNYMYSSGILIFFTKFVSAYSRLLNLGHIQQTLFRLKAATALPEALAAWVGRQREPEPARCPMRIWSLGNTELPQM